MAEQAAVSGAGRRVSEGRRTDSDVTALLRRASSGDAEAWDRAFEVLYDELRRVAARQMAGENAGHTLQTTALVNEAYLKLVRGSNRNATDRQHFVALAGRAMRQVLVDHARSRRAAKRGGGVRPVTLDDGALGGVLGEVAADDEIIALDEALGRLDKLDSKLRQVVELRFFAGLQGGEVAALLGVTSRTERNYWARARAWLHRELTSGSDGAQAP